MPERPRPNPSFCVVTLSDAAKHRAVNDRILDRLPGEAGQVLSPLGEDRFVVARPAVKRLLFGRDRDELIEVLKEIDGIRDAAFEGGEQVRTQYRERASVAAPVQVFLAS